MKRFLTLAILPFLAAGLLAQTQKAATDAKARSAAAPLSKYEAEKARYVKHQGEWRRRYDLERQRYLARKAVVDKKLKREIDRRLKLLASSYSKTRDRAHHKLVVLAREHGRPDVKKTADRLHVAYSDYWDRVWRLRRAMRYGTIAVRAQNVQLLGMDTVPVSLGVGTPVRIQLPRTRSISIGTTAVVPLGR